MMWIIIIILLLLILCWLVLTPLEVSVDTRIPWISLRWITIGKAIAVCENEKWLLKLSILFFHKQWELEKLIFKNKKKKKHVKPIRRKGKSGLDKLKKLVNVIKTFRVTGWHIAIDSDDTMTNSWLYPLNFSRYTRDHLYINFTDENYIVITIRNVPWKLVYALLR